MRNILDFLYRSRFFLLFAVLEVFALTFITRHNGYQQSMILSASSGFTGNLQERYNNIAYYFSLKQANEALLEENARLRAGAPESYVEDSKLVFFRNDTMYYQRFEYVPARVIRNTFDRGSNYLVLDKGSNDNIRKDMGVITSQGAVGIVHSVSEHYCAVLSLLHKDMRISGRIKRNGYVGTLKWKGVSPEEATLEEVPAHVDLHIGDSVVTSGFSLIFPAGIPLGRIKDHYIREGDHFYSISLELATPFRQIDHVYVVRDLSKEELNTLKLPENE